MTALSPINNVAIATEQLLEEMRALDAAELRRQLAETLGYTAQSLMRAAVIVRVLEDKGEDLSDLRLGLLGYLRRIAHGQVRAEAVVRFAEYPSLLKRVAALPLPDQDRLASGDPLPMVIRREDGSYDTRMVDPLRLPYIDAKRLIGPNRIHDQADQILLIESQGQRPKQASRVARTGRITADRSRGGIVVGRTFVPIADVLDALAQLSDSGDELDTAQLTEPVGLRLTEAEHTNLKVLAARQKQSISQLIRRAMRAGGLLDNREQT